MRRFLAPTIALALGALCALLLAACGASNSQLLSSGDASSLNSLLDQFAAQAAQGQCTSVAATARSEASRLQAQTKLDPQLRDALVQGFTHLSTLASQGGSACSGIATTTTPTTSTQTKTQKTHTTPTQTTTHTTPTQTTTTTQSTPTNTGGTGGIGQ